MANSVDWVHVSNSFDFFSNTDQNGSNRPLETISLIATTKWEEITIEMLGQAISDGETYE